MASNLERVPRPSSLGLRAAAAPDLVAHVFEVGHGALTVLACTALDRVQDSLPLVPEDLLQLPVLARLRLSDCTVVLVPREVPRVAQVVRAQLALIVLLNLACL